MAMDEKVVLKLKELLAERDRIDRELEAITGRGDVPKRGRPRKMDEGQPKSPAGGSNSEPTS
jgi:hypothetical protein